MGFKGMFLSPYTLYFKSIMEIQRFFIWDKLLHFPFILWDNNIFKLIGEKLNGYIEHGEIKVGIISSGKNCVVVDLKKGPSKSIQLSVEGWSHIQVLDYEDFCL